jgi:membrane fusion protein, heavy metal efflux system
MNYTRCRTIGRRNVVRLGIGALVALVLAGCRGGDATEGPPRTIPRRASVSAGGLNVAFPEEAPALEQIRTATVHKGTALIAVIAPARIVASIDGHSEEGGHEILFDSPDVTSLYSQYRQSEANVLRTAKNLARISDMYQSQTATAKDLNEAENDAATARAIMSEYKGKLRGLGFNPGELEKAKPGTVWLMCDVAETQLRDVQQGEQVRIQFNALPGRTVIGREEAIGEVIDPVTRTVKVRVSAPNAGGELLPAMFARVDFGDPVPGVVSLPTSAIVTVEGNDYVFVATSPVNFQRRAVTLLSSGADQAIVLRGLEDGESVVSSGAMLLKGLSFGY